MTEVRRELDVEALRKCLENASSESKIYIGGDSVRFKVRGEWYADYSVVCIVHHDGCRGCSIFGEVTRERDFDSKKNRPILRLMNETYKISELFQRIQDLIDDREVEVHLDINPDKQHGSSCAVQQAVGYIQGTCNVKPLVKPKAFAASFGADRLQDIIDMKAGLKKSKRHQARRRAA